jgi:DNA-binding NarL/FixJ family response regulator
MGRYSNFPQALLSGQSGRAALATKRPNCQRSPSPRVHALHRRLSPETQRQLQTEYQTGTSANQLAIRYQLNRASVRRLIQRGGIPPNRRSLTEAEVEQAVELYATGLTVARVAAQLGRPPTTVHATLRQRGVQLRSRHDYD